MFGEFRFPFPFPFVISVRFGDGISVSNSSLDMENCPRPAAEVGEASGEELGIVVTPIVGPRSLDHR
jgi:hypothetical protein